jgi:hypothetical protein
MTWQPGQPVVTEQDHAERGQWRLDRKRERRASNRRIDWYPDKLAGGLINANVGTWVGGDYSGINNRTLSNGPSAAT